MRRALPVLAALLASPGVAAAYDVVPMSLAVGTDSVWVAGPGGALTRVDVASGTVAARASDPGGAGTRALAVDGGDLWVLGTGRLARLDARTLTPRGAWRVPRTMHELVVTRAGVWSLVGRSGRVVRVVPGGFREVPARQTALATLAGGGGRMYALAVRRRDGRTHCFLKRLDEATARVEDGAPIGCTPWRIVADDRWVWALYGGGRTIVRRDARTARGPQRTVRAIPFPIDAAAAGGSLLVMGDYGAGFRRVDRARAVPVGPVITITPQPAALATGPAGAWAASAANGGVLMELADGATQPARTIPLG